MKAHHNEPLGVELGQDKALLQDHEHDSHSSEELLFLADDGNRLSGRRRQWVWLFLVASLIATITALVLAGVWRHTAPLHNASQSKAPQLAIDLHPENHNTRQPTTLKFHWNITSSYLSPDETRKRIYLVNGMQVSRLQCPSI